VHGLPEGGANPFDKKFAAEELTVFIVKCHGVFTLKITPVFTASAHVKPLSSCSNTAVPLLAPAKTHWLLYLWISEA